MKTYQDCLDYLYSFISYEKNTNWTYDNKTFNLDRFKRFLARLGNPQDSLKAIHVAGSDGKGSTCATIAFTLKTAGYKTGLFTSPHLHSVRERIQIDGEWISKRSFMHWMNVLRKHIESSKEPRKGFTTFFELLTAMAFLQFQKQNVEFAVIETGLGGRLDSTNVMHPILTCITHISLEHTDKLGNTLEKITDEKLGITRPGVPVVIGHQDQGLYSHVKRRLLAHQTPVIYVDRVYRIQESRVGKKYRTITFQTNKRKTQVIQTPLLGHYQQQNALTAYACLDTLKENRHISIKSSLLRRGFQETVWPGRFEIIRNPDHPIIVLDVAHTVKGTVALNQSLKEVFPDRKRILVLGFMRDKNIRGMLENLIQPKDFVVFTNAPTPRAISVEELKAMVETKTLPQVEFQYESDPKQALHTAKGLAGRQDIILVAGSLYLVGDIRSLLMKRSY